MSWQVKLTFWFSAGILLFAQVITLVTFIWSVWPYRPLTIDEPLPIMIKEVEANDSVLYKANYCWKGSYPLIVERRIIGNIEYPFPTVSARSVNGCFNQVLSTPPIPKNMPPGEYTLKLVGIYKVNPVRNIRIEIYTEPFTIVAE